MLEQLRRSGNASVKFSNAISHFTVIFSGAERQAPASTFARESGATGGRAADIFVALPGGRPELSAADIVQATGREPCFTCVRYLAQLVESRGMPSCHRTPPPAVAGHSR